MLQRLHNYKGVAGREHMYNLDVCTLQLGCVALGPAHFLAVVRSYLQERSAFEEDAVRTEVLMEVILHLYSARHSEGMSEASSRDGLQYHIVQILCAGPMPFSRLVKALASGQRQRHEAELAEVVREVADFDEGQSTYALKPEFLPMYDPFYYSRPPNIASKCAEYVNGALTRQSFSPPPPLPRWLPPVAGLEEIPRTGRALSFIFKTLAGAAAFLNKPNLFRSVISERGLSVIIQLLTVALAQEKDLARKDRLTTVALLELGEDDISLCQILAHLREQEPRALDTLAQAQLRWIQSALLAAAADDDTRARLTALGFAATTSEAKKAKTSQGSDKAEKAKQRQAKLMARFAKKQAKFQLAATSEATAQGGAAGAEPMATTPDEGQSSEVGKDAEAPLRCLQCQEESHPGTSDKIFIILGNLHRSAVLKPMHPPQTEAGATSGFASYNCSSPSEGEAYFSSCSHALHLSCWERATLGPELRQRMLQGRARFECPLCRTRSNMVLPLLGVSHSRRIAFDGHGAGLIPDAEGAADWLAPLRGAVAALGPFSKASVREKPRPVEGGFLPGLLSITEDAAVNFSALNRDLNHIVLAQTLRHRDEGHADGATCALLWRTLGQTVASLEFAARPETSPASDHRAAAPTTFTALRHLADAALAGPSLDRGTIGEEHIQAQELLTSLFHPDDEGGADVAGDPFTVLVVGSMLLSQFTSDPKTWSSAVVGTEADDRLPLAALVRACAELTLLRQVFLLLTTFATSGDALSESALSAPDTHMASAEDCEAMGALAQGIAARLGRSALGATFTDPMVVNLVAAKCSSDFLRKAYLLQLVLDVRGGGG